MKFVVETIVEDELEILGVGVVDADEDDAECFDFDVIVNDEHVESGVGETGSNA